MWMKFFILAILFCTAASSSKNAGAKSKKPTEETENEKMEKVKITFFNDDVASARKTLDQSIFIGEEDIENLLNGSQEDAESDPEPPSEEAARLANVFAEFTPEKKPAGLDPKAEALYENALDVLGKRRWSMIDPFDIRSAYVDMEESAKLGHPDAQKIIGFAYLFGDMRWSIKEAREIFEKLAETGSPDAHLGLGFIYSTGLGLDQPDPARGLLHYTFSALGGNPLAQMAVAYRYHAGVNVMANCDTALAWYRRVAKRVADRVKMTGAPSVQRIRLPDEVESSTSGSGTLLDTNVFSYYKYLAETGDIQAKLALAQLYLTGGKGVPMDLHEAAKYFTVAAEAGNSQAFAYLGRMYLEGTPATPQNNNTALKYFQRAAEKGNAIAQSGLGLMLLNGWGVQQDTVMALKLFNMAAEQGSADGNFHMGQIYYYGISVEQNYKSALRHFQLASQAGHLTALYNLAHMHAAGIGMLRSCSLATEMLKNVAERGRWAERFMDAFGKFQSGAVDEAAIRYLFLAELGFEVAQSNFAFIMDQSEGRQHLFYSDQTYRRAFMYWQRSANQEYGFARVKLGDYSYYGLGTPVDFGIAANHYKVAGTNHQNAQAFFNLAYMYEKGLGVTRDLHLAKRYYDLASDTATEAFVPVAMALLKLRFLFLYDYFFETPLSFLPQMESIDKILGPHWDIYAMSLFIGLIVILIFNYISNRAAPNNILRSAQPIIRQNSHSNGLRQAGEADNLANNGAE